MTEQKIKKLTDYHHVRLKTEMYFGSRSPHTQVVVDYVDGKPVTKEYTWVPALYTAFREILDNSLDEMLGHGHGNRLDVTYDEATREMSVEDNGRGVPTEWDEDHGMHAATLALSHARAGRNFEERGEVAGTNGIGAAGVNFCSEYFNLEIYRNNEKFVQCFTEGNAVFGDEHQIGAPKITSKLNKTGTKITFRLSTKVFPDTSLPEPFVRSRITEIAIANPLLKVFYNGEQIRVKPRPEQTLFPSIKPITIEIKEDNFRSRFWLVPNWIDDGDHFHTLVNNIPALNGGVHIESFRRIFYGNLLTALEKDSKRRKLSPNRTDVTEGILLYNITTMRAPNFDSQSKTRLINEEVSQFMRKQLEDPELYREVIRKNKEWIEEIYERCAKRTSKKDAADIAKAAKKASRNKVAGLMDANGSDRSKCILFLAEGESAISGMGAVRDPDIHGGLGLRGKVLNVNGENLKKVIDNQALQNIMNSMGLVLGEKATDANLRYGSVYIAHDMDPDGLNIGALIINFFHSYWPELFDPKRDARIHIFRTPFIIAEKGKIRKYWYAHNYQDFDPIAHSGWGITRAKGLGTLTKEDWKYSLANPEVYAVVDDGNMKETLDLIFNGDRSDDRKAWIGI